MRKLKTGLLVGNFLAGLILAGAASSSALASQNAEAEARNGQFISEAFDRWAAGGNTFFNDVLAPDVVWTIEGSGPSAGVYRGRDSLLAMVKPFADRLAQPVRPVSKNVWADGDHVIVRWAGVARARDGQDYANDYVWIFRMQNGQAVEVTAFLDLAPFDDVLRRVPEPPAN